MQLRRSIASHQENFTQLRQRKLQVPTNRSTGAQIIYKRFYYTTRELLKYIQELGGGRRSRNKLFKDAFKESVFLVNQFQVFGIGTLKLQSTDQVLLGCNEEGVGFLFLHANKGRSRSDRGLDLQVSIMGPWDFLGIYSPVRTMPLGKLRCQVHDAGRNNQLWEDRIGLASAM